MNYQELIESIKENEGFRGMPYNDTAGYPTIGYGTKLPLSEYEATLLLKNRLDKIVQEIISAKPFFVDLPETIQNVIAEMGYQLGTPKLMEFKKMWNAVENEDWEEMINQMYLSKWYQETPHRVERLASKVKNFIKGE